MIKTDLSFNYRNDINGKKQLNAPKRSEVDMEELTMIKSPKDEELRSWGYRKFAFNVLVSDRLGPNREIPDSRDPLCKAQVYLSDLPKASIVICFYNEAKSVLLRMITSIFERTPKNLIHEVLVVDDNSDENVSPPLEELRQLFKTEWPYQPLKLVKTPKQEGLIRARIFGAKMATGEVLIFLDSHCEVGNQWIEPLLSRIKDNPHKVVAPIIDIIQPDDFKYVGSPVCYGGFNWGLHFKWRVHRWSP